MLNLSALRRGRILSGRLGVFSLALLAVAGMGIGRALYPPENRFSVMTSTMSFLGSPDAHRNPDGWRYWQVGTTGALLLLTLLTYQRIGARIGQPRCLVVAASTAYGAALALILAATWIPVSENPFWGGTSCAVIHNPVTIAGIFTMMAAVTLDGITLLVARARPRLLAPFALLGTITACGLASLAFWRWKCAADPSLRIFPGEGIHSTPMWEWIAFACLCLFLAAQALAARSPPPDPHRTHRRHPCCEPVDGPLPLRRQARAARQAAANGSGEDVLRSECNEKQSGNQNDNLPKWERVKFMKLTLALLAALMLTPLAVPQAAAPAAEREPTRITTQDPLTALTPPYPPSDFIESLTIDAQRISIGDGDNWANTWGDDDYLYAFPTDGRGFDRTNRVSCHPVIIEGHPPQISGRDLNSPTGTIPNPKGQHARKVCGLLMVDGVLYAWVRNLNLPGAPKGTGAGMMVSTDHGQTWEWVNWNWPELGYPVWMNAGRNYQAARDDYAYYLSPDGPSAYADYPDMVLARVPVASIRDQAAHEFFAGFASPGVPRWGRFESRKPVFTDPSGCFRPNLVYNPGLKRYLLVMSSPYGKWGWWATDNPNRRPHFGMFEAPTPWGPWSVVDYIADWGAPENRFAPNIPSKWISDDGTSFYLLYSCIPKGPYQFNVQRCTVKLKGP